LTQESNLPETRHTPTIDELIELPQPLEAQISPDGAYVAYLVKQPDWKENEYLTLIWLVSSQGSDARQLTFARQASFGQRWSADGQWLAFLSKRDGDEKVQIYRIPPFGGEAERLTEFKNDVQALKWAPDGTAIAFTAVAPESEMEKERREQFGDYLVEDQDYQRNQLWLLDLRDKKIRKLTGGDALHVVDFDWSPDSQRIAFEAWATPDERDADKGWIYTIHVASLELTCLTVQGCATPRWSPLGDRIAYTQFGEPSYYKNNAIYLVLAGGGEAHKIDTSFDEFVTLMDWGPGGIYFTAVQGSEFHLFCIDPQTGDFRQLTPADPPGWASMECTFNQDFKRLALVGADSIHCDEVAVLEPASGELRRLTTFNALIQDWHLGSSEIFRWTSQDGTPIEGVLSKPDDFDPTQKHPLLVVIHGGPSWVSLLARLSGYKRRYYPIQHWLSQGAVILEPNYRGSLGYGEAFQGLNVRNLGVGDAWDVLSGVEALIAKGWVDVERIGAMGWSQGGYISAFLSTYSDRFKAISVGAGISNWVTYYVNTDVHPFTRQYLEATPWEDMEIYRKTSPITYIQQAKTPTLIQHGEKDRRVPIPNAYELYQGLQDMGVETRLVIYKDMPHGINKPRLNRQVMVENRDWFDRWIWGKEQEAQPTPPCYVALPSRDLIAGAVGKPAIEGFSCLPVQDVYHWARRDRAEFRIFSAAAGLLQAGELIPQAEHALQAEEVSEMAARLAQQIQEQGLKKLVVYTGDLMKQAWAQIILGCLQVAAGIAGEVSIEQRQISDPGWGSDRAGKK
jgi:dipeptidyl aminopeptidase/acylaminoacyl peptidase